MSGIPVLGPSDTGRFSVGRCLGKGGFGVVYQAYDRHRHAEVALKFLNHPDLGHLYRLKQEFRALADLVHPNLVVLHELLVEAEQWFIVMELVEGVDFVRHVSFPRDAARHDQVSTGAMPLDDEADVETGSLLLTSARPGAARGQLACDLRRLEPVVRQLALALRYLHSAGKLHRDVKPRNVLVTPTGHVKLLDFGLATELAAQTPGDSTEILGTPTFMAPEQILNMPLTEASDWYSVGVMLFRALTGQLPFRGTFFELLRSKSQQDPPEPSSIVEGIPPLLNDLCRDLLARQPDNRPTGAELLSRLDEVWPHPTSGLRLPAPRPGGVFVGRAEHLRQLADALDLVKAGRSVTVHVHGSSGMGKTALVGRFLRLVRGRERDVVVLAGRCYERESVPYKGLDSLMDALAQHLLQLPGPEVEDLLPQDVTALARLFPILRRVDAVARAQQRGLEVADSQELRRRAVAAFRELLARLGQRHPVVMFIDDLQWGDTDSAVLLAELMRFPNPPPLLLIASYRSEDAASSAALQMLLPQTLADAADRDVRDVTVGELTEAEAYELAEALIDAQGLPARVDTIVRESGRSPFFIDELVQYAVAAARAGQALAAAAPDDATIPTEATLESVIRGRTSHLPPGARRLLNYVAVLGRPMRAAIASQAAELGSGEFDAMVALRAAHLTRIRTTEAGEEIDIYHDRIRETLVAQLSRDELRALHARLAVVLAASPDVDPETLVVHFEGAGQFGRAAVYALAAADRAREALAFDRAARLYRVTLELGHVDAVARREIQVKLGDALAAGGRGRDAAQAYLAAADGALAATQLELQRRAAEQLLRSGHIEEGFHAIRAVLDAMGMKLAGSPTRALLSLLVRRAQIRLRGMRFRERDQSQIAPEELVRVDACWSVATAIGVVDTIRAAEFQARHLLLALRSGDAYRTARAIAIEAAYAAMGGEDTRARNEQLANLAQGLAERVNHPQAIALVMLVKGMSAFLQGRWKAARELLEAADAILRERCTGVAWELDTAHLYYLLALFYLGDVGELGRQLPRLLKEARERDDLTAATNLRTRAAYLTYLAADDPEQAREEVRRGMAHWTRQGFHAQHSWELYARGEVDLYAGRGPEALSYVNQCWPALRRSLLLRIQGTRIESVYLRARSALMAGVDRATAPDARRALFRGAERDAGRLARESALWASGVSGLVLAGVAASRGDRPRAAGLLSEVERRFDATAMPLHAAVARRRRGELLGGQDGRALVQQADGWMAAHAIRNPARMAAMVAPGNYGSDAQA